MKFLTIVNSIDNLKGLPYYKNLIKIGPSYFLDLKKDGWNELLSKHNIVDNEDSEDE